MKCIVGLARVLLIIGLFTSSNLHAGFAANTSHSRANCVGFNESITWHYLEPHWWQVVSIHSRNAGRHDIDTGMNWTWRAAALHVGEITKLHDIWKVQGYHFYQDCATCRKVYDWYTEATDCSIYDGWWDKNG